MLNCSESVRLLSAVARECDFLSGEIAWLGGRVTAGQAMAIELQNFDMLAQHAQALGVLVEKLASGNCDYLFLLREIPLPQVRQRLQDALLGQVPHAASAITDLVLWLDAP